MPAGEAYGWAGPVCCLPDDEVELSAVSEDWEVVRQEAVDRLDRPRDRIDGPAPHPPPLFDQIFF